MLDVELRGHPFGSPLTFSARTRGKQPPHCSFPPGFSLIFGGPLPLWGKANLLWAPLDVCCRGKPKLSQVAGDGELMVKDCVADGVK